MTLKTKTKKFEVEPISAWSVTKYGVTLIVNDPCGKSFKDGCSLDVEDDEQGNFVGIGLFDGEVCWYWSDWEVAKLLTIPHFVAHNGITDLRKLQAWGFKIDESWLLWDTQLIAHVIDSSLKQYGLKALAKNQLGIEYPSYQDITGKGKSHVTLKDVPSELVAEYNAMDCYATYKLYESQVKQLTKDTDILDTTYYQKLEKPVQPIFYGMEQKGITVDLAYLRDLKDTLEAQIMAVKLPILNELGNVNLNSPKQLLEALNAKQIQPTLKGKPSTDKRALEPLKNHLLVSGLLKYSELSTLLSSFVYPYLERAQGNEATIVVHPRFNQCGTRTGRPSCANPNLLQIPRRTDNGKLVRRMFVARSGQLFGDCDFGQIEPRVLAHLSKDPVLCEMFNNGVDFHTFTAERLSISRDRAKVLNLSVGYRATYKSVSQQLKCSWRDAEQQIEQWWSLFPHLYDWQQRLIHESRQSGYCTTLLGRRIKIEALQTSNEWRREGAERQLINNITQGSAAEIMKRAMIGIAKTELKDFHLLVQVYDELLCESPNMENDIHEVVYQMENAMELDVPLTVDATIGRTWGELH